MHESLVGAVAVAMTRRLKGFPGFGFTREVPLPGLVWLVLRTGLFDETSKLSATVSGTIGERGNKVR
jgi:hypothetical protein